MINLMYLQWKKFIKIKKKQRLNPPRRTACADADRLLPRYIAFRNVIFEKKKLFQRSKQVFVILTWGGLVHAALPHIET